MGWAFFKATGARRLSVIETEDPGMMKMWPGPSTTIPAGWLIANGQAISKTIYSALYAALGGDSVYGSGGTTFAIPNYTNFIPMGAGSIVALGDTAGSITHTHTYTVPAHTHNYGLLSHTHTFEHVHYIDHTHSYFGTTGNANNPVFQASLATGSGERVGTNHQHAYSGYTSTASTVYSSGARDVNNGGVSNITTSGNSSGGTAATGTVNSGASTGTTNAVSSILPPVRGVHFIIKT